MALPTLYKTWRIGSNRLQASTFNYVNDFKTAMLHLKNALIGSGVTWKDTSGNVASAPNVWQVVGSSNGTTAGLDAVDRWNSISDINWNSDGSAHSWIVLKQTGIGSDFKLVIDLASNYGTDCKYLGQSTLKGGFFTFCSINGLSGGTTLTCPTPTYPNEYCRVFNSQATSFTWMGGMNSAFRTYSHTWMSTDGKCTRYCVYYNGTPVLFFLIDVPRDPIVIPGPPQLVWNPGNEPFIVAGYSAQAPTEAENAMLISRWLDSASLIRTEVAVQLHPDWYAKVPLSLTAEAGMFSSRDYVTRALNSPNDLDRSYPMLPMGLACYIAQARGKVGTVPDLWSGCPSLIEGDTYPGDGSRQFIQMGDLILPWDRSMPEIL